MEKGGTKFSDLPEDILHRIIAWLAMSNEGATSFARAISVCKAFRQFSNDGDILKVTNFSNMEQYLINESLWNNDGLLAKCASNGNEGAHQIIQHVPFILLGMGGI